MLNENEAKLFKEKAHAQQLKEYMFSQRREVEHLQRQARQYLEMATQKEAHIVALQKEHQKTKKPNGQSSHS